MELTANEVAAIAQVSTVAVLKWRRNGTGPKFEKRGGRFYYQLSDVIRWAVDREVTTRLAALEDRRAEGETRTCRPQDANRNWYE